MLLKNDSTHRILNPVLFTAVRTKVVSPPTLSTRQIGLPIFAPDSLVTYLTHRNRNVRGHGA